VSDVEALVAEREGYVRRGLSHRVAQVDAELARLGIAVEPQVETTDGRPASKGRRGRAAEVETAEG
jgi:hypothetical protein